MRTAGVRVWLSLLVLICAAPAFSHSITGTITGRALDAVWNILSGVCERHNIACN